MGLLAHRIKALRIAKGISQRSLGRKAGLSSATISRIEADKFLPHVSTLSRIASALGVPVAYLMVHTSDLNLSAVIKFDPMAENLIRTFAELSARGRDQLSDFANYLKAREGDRR